MKLNVHPTRMWITVGARAILEEHNITPATLICRHLEGDWGACDPEDQAANDRAVETGERTLGVYTVDNVDNRSVWIITDAPLSMVDRVWREERFFMPGERYALTVLLPEEY